MLVVVMYSTTECAKKSTNQDNYYQIYRGIMIPPLPPTHTIVGFHGPLVCDLKIVKISLGFGDEIPVIFILTILSR